MINQVTTLKMTEFVLGEDSRKDATKSLKSLLKHTTSTQDKQSIYVIINIKIPILRQKDYTPRIIPLTHKLDKITSKSILLITKDPSTPYRKTLTESKLTEGIFTNILSFTKLKSLMKNPKNSTKLFKENDIIVCDWRVYKFMPQVLGNKFYIKNKKVPYKIQFAPQDPTIPKKERSKDVRCDEKYVYAQLKSIIGNTSYIPTDNGDCVCVKIGYNQMEVLELMENLNCVIDYFVDEDKFGPIGGGVLRGVENLGNVFVKTSDSISLPVFIRSKEEKEEVDENDSDFDF